MRRLTTIERAYELARSGPCLNLPEIRKQLKREKFEAVHEHLSGHGLCRELSALCRQRVTKPADADSGA